MKWFLLSTFSLLLIILNVSVSSGQLGIREDFSSLDNWEPFTFPRITKQSEYEIKTTPTGSVLVARSNASASGIRYVGEIDVYACPLARWRWKVDNVYISGDAELKSGDDYPLRVTVIFKYDPEQASLSERAIYGLAKLAHGAYPPHSSLNYIWASRPHAKKIYASLYTDRVKMVILRAGSSELGKWLKEEVNIVDDYQEAFGTMPPAIASIAIMNDSDDTGESSTSYMDYIQVVEKE